MAESGDAARHTRGAKRAMRGMTARVGRGVAAAPCVHTHTHACTHTHTLSLSLSHGWLTGVSFRSLIHTHTLSPSLSLSICAHEVSHGGAQTNMPQPHQGQPLVGPQRPSQPPQRHCPSAALQGAVEGGGAWVARPSHDRPRHEVVPQCRSAVTTQATPSAPATAACTCTCTCTWGQPSREAGPGALDGAQHV